MMILKWTRQMDEYKERQLQEGRGRPQCHVCKESIIAEQEMDGKVQHMTVDGKQVPVHEDCRYEGLESVGRGSPHGGCHGS